ncbi:hypothetical protein MUN76_15190 [Leucobacter rhizosphaerae]|uniref:Uncharacterized protein n=1 Tax=Leucobacter rhizosphaerae TaxID=2932245 RepID=A0ABY4FW09_9MICO|nr:hypothetical protein [Leucobacter rhizosphaerae]UOQ60354.1 hypothetical protein MUN76_15190 [Leucobacter rhizosphaerae]
MSKRIDHAEQARTLLEPLDSRYSDFDRVQFVAEAHVHATLAMVEQQRIANIIALYHHDPEKQTGGSASDFANEAWDHLADGPIRQALGLDK